MSLEELPSGARARLGSTSLRHGDQVTALCHAPDGASLWTAGQDGRIRRWALPGGELAEELLGAGGPVTALALAPDGTTLAAAEEGKVSLRGLGGGSTRSVGIPGLAPLDLAFTHEGATLALAGRDHRVHLVDVAEARVRRTLEGHEDALHSVAVSPDGTRLASAGWDGTARLWDLATGELLHTLERQSGWAGSVDFAPDGSRLAVGVEGGVLLWDPAAGQEAGRLAGLERELVSLAYSPSGRHLATLDFGRRARLWDVAQGRPLRDLEWREGLLFSLSFSPDGAELAASCDSMARRWDVSTGEEVDPGPGHRGAVHGVAVVGDGEVVLTCGADGALAAWQEGRPRWRRSAEHWSLASAVVVRVDRAQAALARWDGSVRLHDLGSGEEVARLDGHRGEVTAVAYHPRADQLASGSWDRHVLLWTTPGQGGESQPVTQHAGPVSGLAFSPDGGRIASASWDRTVRLTELASGATAASLTGHAGPVKCVAFSPDGARIASGGAGGLVHLWQGADGVATGTLEGGSGWVYALAFAPSSDRLAVGGDDGRVRVFDLSGGGPPQVLEGHQGWVHALAWSADGRRLVSGGAEGTALVWDLGT